MTKIKLILSLVGIVALWGLITPLFEFPDEQAHFGTTTFLNSQKRLPTYHEADMNKEMHETQQLLGVLRDDKGNNSYTYHPEHNLEYTNDFVGKYELDIKKLNTPANRSTYIKEEAARYPKLYYLFSGLFLKIVNSKDLITRVFTVRLSSLFITAAMALTLYQSGLLIFKNKLSAFTLASITMLQPMFTFTTAGINSDNLYNLLFMVILYFCLKIIKNGINPKNILLLTLTIAASIYTKPQGLIALPIVFTALGLYILKERRFKLIGWVLAILVLVISISWPQLQKYQAFFTVQNLHQAVLIDYLKFSLNKLLTQNVVWYWGVFKWLGVVLPPIYWRVANRVILLSAFGLLIYFYKAIKKRSIIANPLMIIFLILSTLIYAGVIFWFDWQYVKGWGFSLGIQARYFFPTILAHMALIQTGLLSFGWNKRAQAWINRGLALLFIWLQLGGLWTVIRSYYSTLNLYTFIIQVSQYKPFYAKGNWWYLWFGIYSLSLTYMTSLLVFKNHNSKTK